MHSNANAVASALVAAPTSLSSSVSGTTVTLHWSAPPGAVTSYIIVAGSFPGLTDLASFDTGSATTSVIVLNVPARNYFVRVRARVGAEVGDASNEISLTVEGSNCSGDFYGPFAIHASGQGSSVTLTWDRSDLGCPASDYVIEAGSSRGGTDQANFRTGSSQPRYDAVGVSPGTYYVRVRAANAVAVGLSFVENVLVFGPGCLYSVAPSTVFVSRGGFATSSLSVETGPSCSWTVTADASWLFPNGGALPTSGVGSRTVSMNVNANVGPVRTGTVQVRWPGGGVDVPATQNGF